MDIEPSRSIYDALFSWGCLAAVVWDGVRIDQGPGSRNPTAEDGGSFNRKLGWQGH